MTVVILCPGPSLQRHSPAEIEPGALVIAINLAVEFTQADIWFAMDEGPIQKTKAWPSTKVVTRAMGAKDHPSSWFEHQAPTMGLAWEHFDEAARKRRAPPDIRAEWFTIESSLPQWRSPVYTIQGALLAALNAEPDRIEILGMTMAGKGYFKQAEYQGYFDSVRWERETRAYQLFLTEARRRGIEVVNSDLVKAL